MSNISVQDIQRDLADFLHRLEAGESFLVFKGAQVLAEVRPIAAPVSQPRPFGLCAGKFAVPKDFDSPLPLEVLQTFEGP